MRCDDCSGAEAGGAGEDAEGEGDAEAELLAAAVEGEQDVAEGGVGDEAPSDAEEEAEGAGDFEFVFDETGARVRPEEEAAREAAADAADEVEARGTATTLAPRKRRRRVIQITAQAAGQEHTKEGDVRQVEQGPRKPGIFTARRYFWGYYAPANQGGSTCTVVPLGQVAKPGECHALLDAAANTDADAVAGSNATYEYAGMDAAQPEMLFTRTFTCACAACCRPGTVSVSYRECPFMASTGRWHQQTVHSAHGVARVAAQSRQKVQDFAKRAQPDQIFAVFGSFTDGGRPYWLLLCKKGAYAYTAPKGLKQEDGSTIRKGTWIIDAHWYASTSESQERRSYKLLGDSLVHVPVQSLVQETDLHFERSSRHDSILGDECHLKIMRWNFSNVAQ